MEAFNSVVQLIKVLFVIVFIHELGHFLAARLCGMRADVFAIGMGPRLFGWNKRTGFSFGKMKYDNDGTGETDYRLCILPIGGYVKIAGMVDESMDTSNLAAEPQPWEFRAKPALQKAFVISAGVIMNFLLAITIFMSGALIEGRQFSATTTVAFVNPGSPTHSAGLRSGDQIISINGTQVATWEETLELLTVKDLGADRSLVVKRDGQELNLRVEGKSVLDALTQRKGLGLYPAGYKVVVGTVESVMPAAKAGMAAGDTVLAINGVPIVAFDQLLSIVSEAKSSPLEVTWRNAAGERTAQITPLYDGAVNRHRIGVAPSEAGYYGPIVRREYSVGEALAYGAEQTWTSTTMFFKTVGNIIAGKMAFRESIGGPVQIAQIAGRTADKGVGAFWMLVAALSVSIAIINILPFPALDGGHLVFIIIEAIIRREVPVKVKMAFQQFGMIALLLLLAFVTYNDLVR